MGACVTAVDTLADKAEDCKKLGAIKALSADEFFSGASKFNLVLNCATTSVDGAKLASTLLPGGVAVQLGIPGAGISAQLPLLETAFLELKFAGSNTGGRAITTECLRFAAKKGIVPTVEAMPMADVNKAIERINAGEAHFRIVLVNEE
jgi:D-arabinose 1-dehydrogenase-like Zn-dependent alcohol dehydrogenase